MEFLTSSVLGNPHSTNPTSALATERVARCRQTGPEILQRRPGGVRPHLHLQCQRSVEAGGGILSLRRGRPVPPHLRQSQFGGGHPGLRSGQAGLHPLCAGGATRPEGVRLDPGHLLDGGAPEAENKLFAFPAQSNFSGVQHPLEWIARAQELGWDVLLDAAAFVPTNRLDLEPLAPGLRHPLLLQDVRISRPASAPSSPGVRRCRKLHRPWFAGGTISWASVLAESHTLSPGSEGFEDGTLNYTSLPAVEIGLDFLDSVGVEIVHTRVNALAGWLMDELVALRHPNGERVARIYGPIDMEARGGTLALNLYDSQGSPSGPPAGGGKGQCLEDLSPDRVFLQPGSRRVGHGAGEGRDRRVPGPVGEPDDRRSSSGSASTTRAQGPFESPSVSPPPSRTRGPCSSFFREFVEG